MAEPLLSCSCLAAFEPVIHGTERVSGDRGEEEEGGKGVRRTSKSGGNDRGRRATGKETDLAES